MTAVYMGYDVANGRSIVICPIASIETASCQAWINPSVEALLSLPLVLAARQAKEPTLNIHVVTDTIESKARWVEYLLAFPPLKHLAIYFGRGPLLCAQTWPSRSSRTAGLMTRGLQVSGVLNANAIEFLNRLQLTKNGFTTAIRTSCAGYLDWRLPAVQYASIDGSRWTYNDALLTKTILDLVTFAAKPLILLELVGARQGSFDRSTHLTLPSGHLSSSAIVHLNNISLTCDAHVRSLELNCRSDAPSLRAEQVVFRAKHPSPKGLTICQRRNGPMQVVRLRLPHMRHHQRWLSKVTFPATVSVLEAEYHHKATPLSVHEVFKAYPQLKVIRTLQPSGRRHRHPGKHHLYVKAPLDLDCRQAARLLVEPCLSRSRVKAIVARRRAMDVVLGARVAGTYPSAEVSLKIASRLVQLFHGDGGMGLRALASVDPWAHGR